MKKTIIIPQSNDRAAWRHFRKQLVKLSRNHAKGKRETLVNGRLNQLARNIREELEPVLSNVRRVDMLINSGLSLVSAVRELNKGDMVEPFARPIAPPLPYVGKLPPNVCNNPRLTV